MRTLFIVLLVIMTGTSAFGQAPPPRSGGSVEVKSDMADTIVEPRLDNSNPRLNDQVTVTWQYNDAYSRIADQFRVTISLVNGPEVSPIGTSIVGGVERDGRRSHSFRLTSALVGDLTEPKELKLRLVVGGFQVDLDLTVRPPNRKPVIDRVRAPDELVTGQDLAVDADWSEPDNDVCTFRVQRLVSVSPEQWHNVNGESDRLPMYVPIGDLPASAMTTFKLVVTDSSGESEERRFNVLLLPIPSADPSLGGAGAGDPVPPDPAPVASATLLSIALNPSSVRGGERFSLSWTITGPGAERSVVVTAQIQSQTGWGDLSLVGVEGNTLSCVAPLSTSSTSMPVQVKLNVLEGGGTTISAEATLALDPNPPSATPTVDPAPTAQAPVAPARRSSGMREAVPLVPPPLNLDETDLMPEYETVYDPDQHKYVLKRRVRGPNPAPAPARK